MAFIFRGYGASSGRAPHRRSPNNATSTALGTLTLTLPCTVRLLQRWTLPTQMVTASICAGTGDLIHQLGFEDKRLDEVEVRARRPSLARRCHEI